MKLGIKVAFCIKPELNFVSIGTKKEVAARHNLSEARYLKWSSYKEATSLKSLKKYGFDDQWIEPVLWYTKEREVVRFKNAKTCIEKELIKEYEESKNETKR
jgi:hypothetical protein